MHQPDVTPVERAPWSRLDRPPLREQALRRALLAPAGPFGRFELRDAVPSTNSVLAQESLEDDWPDLSVLAAEHQTSGRGRLGRSWTTPPRAALAVSLLLRPGPAVPVGTWGWIPLLGGLAVVRVLRAVAGLPAVLKWPNDVLVPTGPGGEGDPSAPAKVCGVLSEVVPQPQGSAVVLGLGLNVSLSREELPVPTATSLLLCGASTTDRDTLLRACLREVADQYLRWRDAGGDAVACGLAAGLREVCATIGQPVRVELPGGRRTLVGVATGVDDDGRLRLEPSDGGAAVAVAAGDVVHARLPQP